MHARAAIRQQAALLLTGLPTTGANVFTSRVYPFDELPALAVYTGEDARADGGRLDGKSEDRVCQLNIECRAKATTDIEDILDAMAGEVEQAMANNRKINGAANHSQFVVSPNPELEDGTDQPTAMRVISYEVWYRIDPANPGVSI